MSIPTGISVPGGELAYRIGDMVPDPQTLVVVNCAGRTRSIMGAESLRRAGIPNKVVALRNGTMGWELAGFRCDRGRTERFDPGTPKTLSLALERAKRFAEASGVGVIGPLDLDRFEEDPDRTLYVLDVRDPAEFRARHRPGQPQRTGRAVGAGNRQLGRRAQCARRAGGRYRRARAHGRRVAAPDGPSRRVRGGGRAGSRGNRRTRAGAGAGVGAPGGGHRRDRAGRLARSRGGDGGDRSRPQHRFPRRPHPGCAVGRALAAGRAAVISSAARATWC